MRSKDNLEKANAFARELRHAGINIADWLFQQIGVYKKTDKHALTNEFLTAQGVIELAKAEFGLKIAQIDLANWRRKRKLPKLRLRYDYIEGAKKNSYLYKREKIRKFLTWVKDERDKKEKKRLERAHNIPNQTFLNNADVLPQSSRKRLQITQSVIPIAINKSEE